MGYLIAIASSLFIFCYYCKKLSVLKNRVLELQIEIEMAEKDIWASIDKLREDITAIKVQIAKLETKMIFATAIAALVSNGLFQLMLLYVKK